MEYLNKLKKIFKKFKIKNYNDEATKIFLLYSSYSDITISDMMGKDENLYGGGSNKTEIKYQNKIFYFDKQSNKTENIYFLRGKTKSNISCITIFVNKILGEAIIHEIYYDEDCLYPDMKNEYKSGRTILKIALKLIDQIKDKYKIKYVKLQDNSNKLCRNKDQVVRIRLSNMMILSTGETWYGKYGFVPYDKSDENISVNLKKAYMKNKQIMDTKKIKDLKNFDKIINIALKKIKISTDMKKKIYNLYAEYKKNNLLIKDFVSDLLEKKMFNYTCLFFYNIYLELFNELKLYDFHKVTYIKKI
jgi:hypothetical protein